MIVVAIMGILAVASVAGYRKYVQRANRVDATSSLLRLSAAQERYYLQNDRYATTADELTAPPPAGLGIAGTDHGYYDLAIEAAEGGAAVGYVARATASSTGPQRDDDCREFSIDQSGARGARAMSGADGADVISRCWR